MELADDVVLVCTPDVVCLRGANRALSLWERLALRDEGIHTVLNRTDRSLEVQPSLAARVLGAPLLGTVVPDRTSDLEAAVNAGDPARLAGPVQAAMRELVDEVWREPEVTEPAPVGPLRQADLMRRVGSSERGALSVEFASLLLPVGAVLLLIWQLILAGYTVLWANHAAAEGARAYAVEGASHAGVVAAASADLHGHWRDRLIVTPVSATAPAVEVTIPVPLLVPGVGSPWHITTSAANVVEPQAAAMPASDDGAEDGA